MAQTKYKILQETLDKLLAEKDQLSNVDLPKILEDLKDARAQGDLKENADYAAARENQRSIEKRISEINRILDNYEIISDIDKESVSQGNFVTIFDKADNKEYTYQIVSTIEANVSEKKISNESPLGKSLIGHKAGDTVRVNSAKPYEVDIIEIK